MWKHAVVFAMLPVHAIPVAARHADPGDPNHSQHMNMTITLAQLKVTEKILEVRYQIKNDSPHDIWLCDEIDSYGPGFEHYLGDDGETLMVRRRLRAPMELIRDPMLIGRYRRLGPNETRTESVLLHLPICNGGVLTRGARYEVEDGSVTIKRLILEIEFYDEDLPQTVLSLLTRTPEPAKGATVPFSFAEWYGGLRGFTEWHEYLRDRDERLVTPKPVPPLHRPQVAQMVVNDLSVPWVGGLARPRRDPYGRVVGSVGALRLGRCTRAEIRYDPSMLGYFYPYASQQALLSPLEKEYLREQKKITVEDEDRLADLVSEVEKGFYCGIVTEGSTAEVVCYRGAERLASLTVYDNMSVETEAKHRVRYSDGLGSMRRLVQQIQPFELRLECARNLKNLWYRMRFCQYMLGTGPAVGKPPYPEAPKWSELTESAYRYNVNHSNLATYRCPAAGEGRCHYAMNPRCEPNSPGDTVLLFETKAGWNQHGGAELFTFDNHDPKGGCVLLNDGTVKFIRRKEELNQLRWKP